MKFHFVFVQDMNKIHPDREGFAIPEKVASQLFINDKNGAADYAIFLAQTHPGYEVMMLESIEAFYAPLPEKVVKKGWNANGEYITK